MLKKAGVFVMSAVLAGSAGMAQKGLPSRQMYTATVNTHYPQHEDFKETLLSRLKVPPGFTVSVAATSLGKPRVMALREDGSLYVTRRDQGDVLLLSDQDGDGRLETLKTVMTQFRNVHGITIHDGKLFLASDKVVKSATIRPDGSLTDTMTLMNDLPEGGQHPNRMIAFGGDGRMYISVGSDCNDCNETSPYHATIVVADADGRNRQIFARGLRNTIGFDWHPQTSEMWGADNGTDWRGDTIPSEELNRIVRDGDYGWPLVWGKQQVDITREDPLGTTKEAYAKTTQPAVMTFPAHAAPIDFRFIRNAAVFPAGYADDALVSWHGSWNRKMPSGYNVQRIHYENGKPIRISDFFTGLMSKDGKTRFGRPAGILISPKGIVYVADDENGVIYAITYNQTKTS